MTVESFIGLFIFGSAVAALLTEAIKKGWKNVSNNLIAFMSSIVVGGFGTAAAYILTGVVWDLKSIVCLILMIFAVWLGSMVGYDKVIQLLEQLKRKK